MEQAPLAKHGVELLPMNAAILDHLQQDILVARCVVQLVSKVLLVHLGRIPRSAVRVVNESPAVRSEVE